MADNGDELALVTACPLGGLARALGGTRELFLRFQRSGQLYGTLLDARFQHLVHRADPSFAPAACCLVNEQPAQRPNGAATIRCRTDNGRDTPGGPASGPEP